MLICLLKLHDVYFHLNNCVLFAQTFNDLHLLDYCSENKNNNDPGKVGNTPFLQPEPSY